MPGRSPGSRALDVPLGKVGAVLAAETPDAARRILERHLADIDARTARMQRIAHGLRQIITEREDLVTDTIADPMVDKEARRGLAVDLFNHTWTLLETEGPDARPGRRDAPRGARVALSLGRGRRCREPSARASGSAPASTGPGSRGARAAHARRCLAICEAHGLGSWDLAAAYEGLARASRLAGDEEGLVRYRQLALAQIERIPDPEDRAIIAADLATLA